MFNLPPSFVWTTVAEYMDIFDITNMKCTNVGTMKLTTNVFNKVYGILQEEKSKWKRSIVSSKLVSSKHIWSERVYWTPASTCGWCYRCRNKYTNSNGCMGYDECLGVVKYTDRCGYGMFLKVRNCVDRGWSKAKPTPSLGMVLRSGKVVPPKEGWGQTIHIPHSVLTN